MQLRGLPGEPAAYAATTEGLYRVTTSGEATLVAFEDTQVSSLGVSRDWASDGTAFVLVASQGWFRTTDHGETWTALPRPTLSHAETLQVSPDYPLDQSLAVGTYDGAWASQDGGETWTEITAADRIEEDHGLWNFSDGWVLERSETLSGGMHLAADGPDLTAEVAFEGVACDLIGGTYVGGGSLAVAIDGGDETRIDLYSVQRQEQVTLLRVQDLAPGPHTLSIRVVSEPAGIDALVGWHVAPPDAPLRDTGDSSDTGEAGDTGGPGDSGDPSRCRGCATAPAGALAPALWLLTALGLTRRRRRTYSTPTRGSARSWGGPMRR
jgi:hypothetical protein